MIFFSRKNRSKPARRGSAWPIVGYMAFYCTLALVVCLAIAWTYRTLRSHPIFAIDTIEVRGASARTERDLRKALVPFMGRNFFAADLTQARTIAVRHPWVANASVHAHLPRRIEVVVEEYRPAGLVRAGERIIVVAANGHAIAPVEELNEAITNPNLADDLLDRPVLLGVPAGEAGFAVIQKGLAALETIRNTSLLFWGHIETLDLSDERNMIVHLRNVTAPLYLGDEVIPRNLQNYLAIAPYLDKEYPSLAYIELGFPNHIAIMPKEVD